MLSNIGHSAPNPNAQDSQHDNMAIPSLHHTPSPRRLASIRPSTVYRTTVEDQTIEKRHLLAGTLLSPLPQIHRRLHCATAQRSSLQPLQASRRCRLRTAGTRSLHEQSTREPEPCVLFPSGEEVSGRGGPQYGAVVIPGDLANAGR